MDKPLKSVTHGQCDARPTVTFPAAGHHRPLTGTKLYCLVTEANVYMDIAVRSPTCQATATGTHMPYRITQCYLPPGRGDIPAMCVNNLPKAVT